MHNLNVFKTGVKKLGKCLLYKTWKDHNRQGISFIACYLIAANSCLLLMRPN